ncbi:MAG: hypothetical protein RLZZ499_264, partial [Cyanobacteriota bacterium]
DKDLGDREGLDFHNLTNNQIYS